MEVTTTIAPKKSFFRSKLTQKGDTYTIIEATKAPKAAGKSGPENEVASLVESLNNVDLELEREPKAGEKHHDIARKLGKFVETNKNNLTRLLEFEEVALFEKAASKILSTLVNEEEKIIALKKAKVIYTKTKAKALKRNGKRFFSLPPIDSELKDVVQTFLDTLEFHLLGGDLEQLKVSSVRAAADLQPIANPNQVDKIFIISDGGLYQTTVLTPKIQEEFTHAQKSYNLTIRTPDLPPKIVKTPPEESLSRILPTPVVLFHTELLLEFALALTVDKVTTPKHPKTFDGYGTAPPNFETDDYFMEQRVVGVNPCAIRKMTAETKALFETAGMTFPNDNSSYYVWDYRVLDEFSSNKLPMSILLAKFDTAEQSFKPLAVWVKTSKLSDTGNKPVLIKRIDGDVQWEFAKMCVRISDWNVHEVGNHLTLCHFVCEMFDVLTHHCLPKQHPVFQLLLPHFFRTIPLNDDARATLLPKVIAENLSSMSTEEGLRFCSKMIGLWNFQQNYVPVDLKSRGVSDLPDKVYPFKQTALETWNAVRTYVKNSLALLASMSGPNKTIMDNDILLRNWAQAMRTNFTNFPELETASNEALYDALTLMIYTASHQHAAVNYFQAKYMSFLPASPGFMTKFPSETELKNMTMTQLLKLFPSYQTGILQRSMVKMLSTEPVDTMTLVGFNRKKTEDKGAEKKFLVEWPQLDNELTILQAQLKNTLAVYSLNSVTQKTLAQSVLI